MIIPDPVAAHLAHMRLRNLSPASLDQRRYALGRLARHIGCDLPDLLAASESDLDSWQRSLVHLSPRHRSTSAVHVRQFYGWAHTAGLVRQDPAHVLVSVKVPRGLPRPISEDDLTMALSCAPDRIRPMLVLAAYAGLRAAEIAGLLREQVRDTSDPPVLHIIGKGGHERVVPLSDLVLMELQAHGLPSRGFVFGRMDGAAGQNTACRVSQVCNNYLHDLGIPDTLHQLRHRFGSIGYSHSRDLRVVQELMGHRSPSTTSGYVAWSDQTAVATVRALAGEFVRA